MAAGAPVGPVCCGDCPGPAWLSAFCGGITAAAPALCPGLRRPPGQGSVPGAGRLRGALFPHRMELPADPPARIPPGGHSAGAVFCAEYHVLRVLHRRAGQPVEAAAGRRTQLRCILAPANRQLLSDDLLCVRVAESGGHRGESRSPGQGMALCSGHPCRLASDTGAALPGVSALGFCPADLAVPGKNYVGSLPSAVSDGGVREPVHPWAAPGGGCGRSGILRSFADRADAAGDDGPLRRGGQAAGQKMGGLCVRPVLRADPGVDHPGPLHH